jgi:23S rRNA (cytidine1920-2'-O)/16S rRNA (cytidine1409-2'-O)-methyltransferase
VLVGGVAGPEAPVVILVKPQFEAGRAEASRGKGVIRDPAIHRRTLGEVAGALDDAGAVIMGAMPSPITGPAGNIEFLLHARTPASAPPPTGGRAPDQPRADYRDLLDAAVDEAHRDGGG